MNPQVSVIIPAFNRKDLLARALSTVLAQEDVAFEIWVIDDGSTDGTREMIEKDFPSVNYFWQENQGPSAARNRGIERARGEWIAFLDSDDEWTPDKLKTQLYFFEKHPAYSICQTEEIWIRNGVRVNPMAKHKKYGGWIFEKCLPLCIVSPSAVMMHKSLFDETGLFDESLPACEDYDLWLRISCRYPIGLVEQNCVIKYGGHADQRSHEFPAMDRFRIQALTKILNSGKLDAQQTELAQKMLDEKTRIYNLGAQKRGKTYRPEKIYIEKDAQDFPFTKKILSELPGVPVEIIENSKQLVAAAQNQNDPTGHSKRSLLLKKDKGRSFKPFPESEPYLSCDYFTLHLEEGCDLECSYCILQAYLTNPFLTLYVNVEEILENLQQILNANPDQFFRIGTGQLADSLSLDPLTSFSEVLVPFFAKQKNAVLELKTKSNRIEKLLNLKPGGKTIISWSMNSEKIQKEEEHKCASIDERLEAAQKVIAAGYRAGFHFDPLIDYAGWEKDYEETLKKINSKIPAESIAWISMGCLRFMPELKPIMQTRFPKSSLPLGEWVTGTDGKMRYFKPRRIEMYKTMKSLVEKYFPGVTLYLSMESPEVWQKVFGREYGKQDVCKLLDQAGKRNLQPA